ncbi:MAG TPA: hypothetical protein VGR18_09500 [Rubrobacter sp.]|nr:hypothetical protein [Rubrobacter sp.]
MTEGARDQDRGVRGLSSRAASQIAWTLWGLALALAAVGLLFGILAFGAPLPEERGPFLVSIVVLDTLVVLYATLGALIVSRHGRNLIGWIFCFVAVSLAILSSASGYADYALYARDDSLPGAVLAAWVTNWLFIPAVYVSMCYLFFLFPDGRPASPRWRPIIWAATVVAAVATLAPALEPGRLFAFPTVENPFGLAEPFGRIAIVANDITDLAAMPVFLVSLASMVARLRSARGRERLQLKWITYAASLTATSFAAAFAADLLTDLRVASDALFLLGVVGFAGIPVAAGVAILRHKLYDIDRIINRTLVYGALTATLALVYVGSVVSLQALLRVLTGQESTLAVVASTLAMAALFGPLRRRVQGFVDRRFYRRKYDAVKTLAAFSARLREETDLDVLSNDLVGVASRTVQPEHASVWLSPDTATKGRQAD